MFAAGPMAALAADAVAAREDRDAVGRLAAGRILVGEVAVAEQAVPADAPAGQGIHRKTRTKVPDLLLRVPGDRRLHHRGAVDRQKRMSVRARADHEMDRHLMLT